MGWRELRNAPLIEALIIGLRGRPLPTRPVHVDGEFELWEQLQYSDRGELRNEIWHANQTYLGPWSDFILTSLIVYDDMPAIVGQETEELGAMLRMFPKTELSLRCEAAIRLFTVIGKEKAHGLARQLLDSGPAGGVGTEEDVVAAQPRGRQPPVGEGEEDA